MSEGCILGLMGLLYLVIIEEKKNQVCTYLVDLIWIGLSKDGGHILGIMGQIWDDNLGGEPGMYTLGGLNLDWSEPG